MELLNSPALKRLKNIDAGGYGPLLARPYPLNSKRGHNRLAHSIGVYYLLKKHGAPIEERIAGLIHDVSHSAFSHIIDHVIDSGNSKEQNHQDNSHDRFIKKTKIPKLIKKYGFNLNYILDDKNFPLKEKELPNLCADRIDYLFRWAVTFNEITPSAARKILNNLRSKMGNWIFNNFNSAKQYAELFYRLNRKYFASSYSAIMFAAVGNYLKYALQKKYITTADLYTTDKIVLAKIKKYLNKDEHLNLLWRRMNGKIKVKQNRKNYDAHIYCKSRIVDPLFIDKGKIKRLSKAEPNWGKIVRQELKPKEYFLK